MRGFHWREIKDRSTAMGNEIELKFHVAPQDLRNLKAVGGLLGRSRTEETLLSVYFDTPKHKLARNGVSLRVRHNGRERIQNIKSNASQGSFTRGEWEHQISADVPDLHKARGTALAPLLTKKLKRNLGPIFETCIRRTSAPVRRNGSRIEVAFDRGDIRAGRRSAAVSEIELELKHGEKKALFKLAREMTRHVPATLALKSKSERGYELMEGKQLRAARAEPIKLQHDLSTAEAFRFIVRSTLRHITANEPIVRRAEPEGVHQMRVGLRRLRAAISLFSNLVDDRQTERIKSELKWLTGELAPARDLDVYQKDEIGPLLGTSPAKRQLRRLKDEVASRRAAAFKRAKTAVETARYRTLLLDTLQWLEVGSWATRSRRYGVHPIKRFSEGILRQLTKKVMKKGNRLRKLDPRHRHKLRIAIKKLRYASELFESMYARSKSATRRSDFEACLKDLQDSLGRLNDIRVHQALAPKLVAGRSPKKSSARAFAAGIVTGNEQGQIKPLLSAANKSFRKLAHIPPYWA